MADFSWQLQMSSHLEPMRENAEAIEDVLANALQEIAKSSTKQQIAELDKIARNVFIQKEKLQHLYNVGCKLQTEGMADNSRRKAAIEKATTTMKEASFAKEQAAHALLENQTYVEFVSAYKEENPQIGEGVEVDDLIVSSTASSNKDPFSHVPLQKDQESGKYPVIMPCKHVYNYATILAKKNGNWTLKKCVVPGCDKAFPDNRNNLKECAKTKHEITKKEKNIGSSQRQDVGEEIEDL